MKSGLETPQNSLKKHRMKHNLWMTNFYRENWWEIENPFFQMDESGMYEWRISPDDWISLAKACELKFELVETLVEFSTEVHPSIVEFEGVRLSKTEDLQGILTLTLECFSNNPKFFNRFKNEKYFTKSQMEKYFHSAIINNFSDLDTITIVYEQNKEIKGYYMIKKSEEKTYKGIMTAVSSDFRNKGLHIAMQKFCFNVINEPIVTKNATQLNNLSTLNNHIKEGRKIVDVKHIFYKKI